MFAVLKWLMASAGRTFTTPVQQQLKLLPVLFKVATHTHTNSQVPAQHYYPLNLTCPLNTISLFIYRKWCAAVCLPASLSHSCVCLPPQIAPVEIDESYDEMKQDARTCLSLMSQGLLYPEHIPLVLAALEEVRAHTPAYTTGCS